MNKDGLPPSKKQPCPHCGMFFAAENLHEHKVDCPMSPLLVGHDPDYHQNLEKSDES